MTAEESYYLGPGLTGIEQQTAIGFAEAMIQGVYSLMSWFSIMKQYLPYCALHTYIWLDGHPTNEVDQLGGSVMQDHYLSNVADRKTPNQRRFGDQLALGMRQTYIGHVLQLWSESDGIPSKPEDHASTETSCGRV